VQRSVREGHERDASEGSKPKNRSIHGVHDHVSDAGAVQGIHCPGGCRSGLQAHRAGQPVGQGGGGGRGGGGTEGVQLSVREGREREASEGSKPENR
jgi:hypothetical protein